MDRFSRVLVMVMGLWLVAFASGILVLSAANATFPTAPALSLLAPFAAGLVIPLAIGATGAYIAQREGARWWMTATILLVTCAGLSFPVAIIGADRSEIGSLLMIGAGTVALMAAALGAGALGERRRRIGDARWAERGWRCPKCAYDLRGLPAGSGCPECGEVPKPRRRRRLWRRSRGESASTR